MNVKRISGVVIIIFGVIIFLLSNYIAEKVAQGQQVVKTVETATSFSSETKGLGKMATGSGQKQIDKFGRIANGLHLGSFVLVLVGAGLIGFSFIRKK